MKTLIAGTYTSDHASKGIYTFTFDEGKLSQPRLFTEIKSPKYTAADDGHIASIGEFENGAGAALISPEGEILSTIGYEQRTSCYIAFHEDRIYTANYHEGTVSVLDYSDGALKLISKVEIRDGAGCHQVLFHDDMVLVPCLFLDRVAMFDKDLNYKGSLRFEAGTGPRHGVFTKDGKTFYLVSELSNELFRFNTEDWSLTGRVSVLPDGRTHIRDTAAIRLSDDEKNVYVSTRTVDLISVIDAETMEWKQSVYSGGRHPRDFILLDGYLLCANRYSNSVVCFKLKEDGTIGEETGMINVPSAVSLTVMD